MRIRGPFGRLLALGVAVTLALAGATSASAATSLDADDDIPGISFTSGGYLSASSDLRDVYGIPLQAFQTVTIDVRYPTSGADFRTYLYGPSASTVVAGSGRVATGAGTLGRQLLTYTAAAAGTYYFEVQAASGGGSYTMSRTLATPYNIPGTQYGAAAYSITRRMDVSRTRHMVYQLEASPGKTMTLDLSGTSGADFDLRVFDSSATDVNADSPVAVSATPGTSSEHIVFSPPPVPDPSPHWFVDVYSANSVSGDFTLIWNVTGTAMNFNPPLPKATVTVPSRPTPVYANRKFVSRGYLKPRHSAGLKSVKIQCFRYEGGKWVLRRTVYATNQTVSTSTTRYVGTVTLPYRGLWKMRAVHPADTRHSTSYSPYTTTFRAR